MVIEGIAAVRSYAGALFRDINCSSENRIGGNDTLQQSGFLGTILLRKENVSGLQRQVGSGLTVRASEEKQVNQGKLQAKRPKAPTFILNVKPERKPMAEEPKPFLSLEDYDFENLIVDPNHRSGNHFSSSLVLASFFRCYVLYYLSDTCFF